MIDTFYDWIIENLEEGKTLLELGSGETTIKLCEKYEVYSVEHDEKFIGLAKKSNYIHAPIKSYGKYRWYDIDKLEIIKTLKYDMILVDGPTGIIGRQGFLYNLNLFDISVPIIIDDTNRKPELLIANRLGMAFTQNRKKSVFGGKDKNFIVYE